MKSRFDSNAEQPISFPDSNPLDYYFWSKAKEKASSGHHAKSLGVKKSWKTLFTLCETNVIQILNWAIKHLLPRLKAAVTKKED